VIRANGEINLAVQKDLAFGSFGLSFASDFYDLDLDLVAFAVDFHFLVGIEAARPGFELLGQDVDDSDPLVGIGFDISNEEHGFSPG
jgi:hypothetical protein